MERQYTALVRLAGQLHDSYGLDDVDRSWAILDDYRAILNQVQAHIGQRAGRALASKTCGRQAG